MKKRALSFIISVTMAFSLIPVFTVTSAAETEVAAETGTPAGISEKSETGETSQEQQADNTDMKETEPILAYVPLDNRTVNVDRVIYEAESAGFKVMMPDEDLYATRLDGQPLNSNGTRHGDPDKLLEWILEADEKTNYFVISLDQLLSGGLVNSRTLYSNSYSKEYEIIDELIRLSQNNHIYIVDTVTRLASCTLGYDNADINTYSYLRQYNMKPRYVIKNRDLSVKNIVSYYTKDEKGRNIETDKQYEKEVKNSLKTRERKLNLINYILSMDSAGRMKYFIGVDDSNPQNTIQTNEINFIEKKLNGRGLIYSGADELGMMAVLNLMIDYYGYDVKVSATYFGETESSGSGSAYDLETVRENVDKHLESIGVELVETKDADIEIVVLTAPSTNILNSKYVSQMIDYINNNIAKGIPTIVINSAPGTYSGNLEYRMIRECEMSMLLSYSSWGTVGNSIGLALCNGVSRYLYLHSRDNSSDTADIAFLKGLIFSFEKDISYIRGGGKSLFNTYLINKGLSTDNFYQSDEQVEAVNADLENMLKTSSYNVTVNDIIDNLTGCRYFKGLNGECGIIGKIDLSNYSAPFYRTYEIRFDIDVKLKDITLNNFNDSLSINMPYTPKEGEVTYSLDLYYLDADGKLQKLPCTYDKETGTVSFDTGIMPYFFVNVRNMDADKASSLFTDVPNSAWYFGYVMYAYEKGWMTGTSATTFEPKLPMTYAMLSKALERMEGDKTDGIEDGGDSGSDFVMENSKLGVTREQLADILYRYAQHRGIEISKGKESGIYAYADVFAIEPELRESFDWACTNGLITGTGGGTKLEPKALATRAETAAVLKRLEEL